MVGVDATPGGGADDRPDGSAQGRSPIGAEAAGDLAVHRHWPKIALAAIVVRRRIWMCEKGEQAVLHGEVALAQPSTLTVARLQRQETLNPEGDGLLLSPEIAC